jgi:RNA polymerase sigma factor (sigma-70 family)
MTHLAAAPGALDALSDVELIARVRAGSDAAFSMLYERHLGAARAAARSLGASRADVDDLTSEAFTRLLAAMRRGGGPEVAFRPYLMTCVRNAFYDKGRKDGRVDVPGEVPEDVNLALLNVPPDSEDARMVAAAFASLPERWQMVLWHTEVEGRPAAEVGPLLGLAPNAVAALAYRAREGLRQAYLQAHLQLPPPDACRDTVTKLGAYVRDGLSSRDRRHVDEHLKNCERCTALLLELQEVSTSLRGVLVPILLGVSGTAFVTQIASGGGLATVLRWRPRGPKAQVAVAAAVVGGVVGIAVAVAALTGGDAGDKVEAASPTTSTTETAAPSTTPPQASTPPSASIVSPPSSIAPVAPVVVVPSTSPPVPVVTVVRSTTTAPRVVQTTVRTAPPRAATTTTTRPAATTTTEPATTTTTEPASTTTTTTTTTTPAPPPPPALRLGVTAVGPAYAGLGAAVQVSLGQGAAPSEAGELGAAAVAPAATTGPVTVTVTGAPVADWDRADCGPGPSCTVPAGTTSVDIRLDLTAVTAAGSIPISVASTADGAAAAHADFTVAALARPVGLEYFAVDRGTVAMAANTVIACVPEPRTTCDANNNEEQNLGRVSVGPGAVDSSSADLHLPAGATVRWALLQWGGDPGGAPDPARRGDVELTTPDGNAVAVHAAGVRTAPGDAAYTARADVTSIVRALAQPAGTYTVADVQTGEGAGQFGGWSLIVAYRQPDLPRSVIAVFDDPSAPSGLLTRVDHSADVVYSLTGLAAPQHAADVQLGVVAYDGDRGITGDTVKVGAVVAGDAENFFGSSIEVGGAARDPSFPNQYGFDAHLDTVAKAVTPADAGPAVTVHIGEGNDGIYVGAVTLVVAL